ncbi:hypothetical protein F2Q68_00037211 [Brassica cretica]|uniref:Zinc finger LSD1-type domain-containing protein n=1 Tax=Brassica cretica TaxID=69181 RepID=A0A8S9H3U2_BRACR|nr:hypothetical protein F2Q68_00037211 [Brassica cretica]
MSSASSVRGFCNRDPSSNSNRSFLALNWILGFGFKASSFVFLREKSEMQDQLVCHGCRNTLLYPRGATNVRCALCNTINMVPLHPPPPPPHHHAHAGMDMAHIVCGGCRTMLMYTRGASSVRCSCCQTVNLVPATPPTNQPAHVNCGNCRTTLMYPYGAPSVRCAVCQFVTNVNMGNGRVPFPTNHPNGTASSPGSMPSTSTQSTPPSQTQTVVVENPMSVNESGKLLFAGFAIEIPLPTPIEMQDQLVCHGCRNTLLYPRGATNVRCALCNTINMVPLHPPPHHHGMDMAHIVCGGCRTMLMYTRGASSVRCSCCQTVNLVPATPPANQPAHVNCGNCRTTLMYPYGAPSVRCAVCQFVTNVNMGNGRVPFPTNQPNGTASPGPMPSTSTQSTPPSQTQTVVVENPMSVNESGKLVSNVVVGVTTDKKK